MALAMQPRVGPEVAAAPGSRLQDQVVAGLNAGLSLMQEKAHAGYEATLERVGTAQAGQALLTAGGEVSELAIHAKVAARTAADMGADLEQKTRAAAESFEEAARTLRDARSSSENVPQGIGGIEDFDRLALAYESRAALFRKLLQSIEEVLPSAPEMTPAEEDAARILQLKDHCLITKRKVAEGAEYIRRSACETLSSATSGEPRSNILTSHCSGKSVCL
eukprot:TRINITY_DN6103_c0_g1_i2.p1 TRINITY_DN6103_c0_g1~~TRINITY_DN6103_c0_g1_i2.p1  ORF type:complete len:246 (-),score=70.59 TRINITY_DN6103_c0_g1_i2:169-831(-)